MTTSPTTFAVSLRQAASVGVLAAAVSLAFLGSRGLYETTEGRYAECAREMLETGNYMEPTLGYRPHWTKPPLTYWAIAGGMRLLGVNAWGARAFGAVAFVLTALLVSLIGRQLFDTATGWLAGVIYATSAFPVFGAWTVSTDTLLTLWETLAVAAYLAAWHATDARARRIRLLGMWIAFGLGFATKGPPALLPLAALAVWQRGDPARPSLWRWPGIVAFLLVGLSWYVLVSVRHHGLLGYFVGTEVMDRVAAGNVHNKGWYKGLTLLLPVLLLGNGVWLFPAARITWKARASLRIATLRAWLHTTPGASFALLWVAIPFAVFALSRSKLPLYVLPLCVPVTLLLARLLTAQGFHTPRAVGWWAAAAAGSLIAAKALAAQVGSEADMRPVAELCHRVAPPKARFVLVQKSKCHGLQFYLNGNLERITLTGTEPWANGRLRDLVADIASPTDRPRVLIVPSGLETVLATALGKDAAALHAAHANGFAVLPPQASPTPKMTPIAESLP